jgi:Fe-Mn family superoxide dismutase
MIHQLPALPYSYDALEPYIDAETMEIHHTKHHAAYVEKLNKALEGHADLQGKPCEALLAGLETLPSEIRMAVRNNGGGHMNHTLFWTMMRRDGGGPPSGEVAQAINKAFGTFAQFKSKFTQAAVSQFGSGWAWLCLCDGDLAVRSSPNQDSPLMNEGGVPILGLDLWEHAYYLRYRNRRPEYVEAWWNVVNWEQVAENLITANKAGRVLGMPVPGPQAAPREARRRAASL